MEPLNKDETVTTLDSCSKKIIKRYNNERLRQIKDKELVVTTHTTHKSN